MDILSGLTVVEHATEIAGPYLTKLFADAGADVIKVEPPGGDPLRARGAGTNASGDGALFRFLNFGKRSVVLHRSDPGFQDLLAGCDLLVEGWGADAAEVARLRERFTSLVVVSLSPFGLAGPYRDRPATPFTVEAESGAMSTRARADQPPVQVGGRLFEWLLGSYAATAAIAATRRARATGVGELIDCSLLEVCHIGGCGVAELLHQLAGRPATTEPIRQIEVPSIEPTADGWVGFNTNSRQQFESFLVMIGRTDLLDDDDSWAYAATRHERLDEWNEIVHAWTTQHSTAEIVELASVLRIPVAQVNNGKTVLDHPQFLARSIWGDAPDGTFTYPRPPMQINGDRPQPRGDSPSLGEHQGCASPRPQRGPRRPTDPSGALPLAGTRVIDATAWWAGPASTQLLAALGADVIHLESIQHVDGGRLVAGNVALPSWWERSPLYLRSNTNKRSLTLDLDSSHGKDLFLRLVEDADVIVENFSPRVFDNFGLTWETLSELNPRLVMVRMPAFGLDGPWRDNVGFAQTMEQVTGLAWVTGHIDDQPRIPRGPCDPLAGMNAAFATMLGLTERDASGHGSFIEVSMVEAALNAAAEQVVEYTAHGNLVGRLGNRSVDAAPQGLYKGRGTDDWLAISVATDAQWQALRGVLGNPAWAADPSFDTVDGRRLAHDRIDAHLADWAEGRSVADTADELVANGIPAAQVRDARLSTTHPQLVARGFFEVVDHPVVGPLAVAGLPFRFGTVDRWHRTPSPTLGEHNVEILAELGLDAAAIDKLGDDHVVGTRPLGVDY